MLIKGFKAEPRRRAPPLDAPPALAHAHGRPTVRPARRRGRAAPPAGSAASARRTSSRHRPSTRCRWARRPVSSHPIQVSRARRRRAHAANPTPPSQPCAEPTRYRTCGPTDGPAPPGYSGAISVFQTRRCASVFTNANVRCRTAPTVSGTSTLIEYVPTSAQRRADAPAGVAECALPAARDKGTAGDRCQVVVHVDADTLAAEDGRPKAAEPPASERWQRRRGRRQTAARRGGRDPPLCGDGPAAGLRRLEGHDAARSRRRGAEGRPQATHRIARASAPAGGPRRTLPVPGVHGNAFRPPNTCGTARAVGRRRSTIWCSSAGCHESRTSHSYSAS